MQKTVSVNLPDGTTVDLSTVETPLVKKRPIKKPSNYRGLDFSTKAFYDFPRFLIKDQHGMTAPCDNFYYCTTCQEICSVQRAKKEINILYNPYKVELSTQAGALKANYGKNPNEKLCPICNIYIQEAEYATEGKEGPDGKPEKVVVFYYKCRFCLWNTLHFNIHLEKTNLVRLASELSKRHKLVREQETTDSLMYIMSGLKMTNQALEQEEHRHSKQMSKTIAFGSSLNTKDDKNKNVWDVHQLYSKFNMNKTRTLGDDFKHDHGRRINKFSSLLYQKTEEQPNPVSPGGKNTNPETPTKDENTEDNKNDVSNFIEDDSNMSVLGNKQITDTIGQMIGNMMDTMPSPEKSTHEDPVNKAEVERNVIQIFKDGRRIMDSEADAANNMDTFLTSYKQQRIFTNIFEQLPTKVYDGYESLIPLDSTLVPIINKSCATDLCKNGLIYYDKGSEAFTLKFHCELSEYIPVLRLSKIRVNTPPDYSTFRFTLWNKSKYNTRVHYTLPQDSSQMYRFADNQKEFDHMLVTSEKDGETSTLFDIEVLNSYAGDILLNVESHLFMQGTDNLMVRYQMIFQLGDEEAKKSYFSRYRQ